MAVQSDWKIGMPCFKASRNSEVLEFVERSLSLQNLTYQEARLSEKAAAERLNNFPDTHVLPVLRIVHFSV